MNLNDHLLRLADETTEELEKLDPATLRKEQADVERIFSPAIWLKLRRAFTPKGLPFFQFYMDLYRVRLGMPYDGNLKQDYKRAADRIIALQSPIDKLPLSPTAVNHIALTRPLVNRVLNALNQGHADDANNWARFNAVFVPMLVEVAKDKGVYMAPMHQTGRERWAQFKPMSPKQEEIERLRDTDPEAYALMKQKGQAIAEINAGIKADIEAQGKEVKTGFLAGRPVLIGVDKATGEEMVHDLDGEVLPKGDFFEKVRAKAEAMARLSRVPQRTQVKPSEVRVVSDEALDQLEGDVVWMAFTDDKAKQSRLTRILPTKLTRKFISTEEGLRVEGHRVVVEGRYKGVFLDDLINSEGRLIEGTAYAFNPRGNKVSKVPQKMDPSEREPYVSVAEVVEQRTFQFKKITVTTQKLYIKIDGSRQSTVLRNALKSLACNTGTQRGCIPSVVYEAVEGSKAAGFYFEPKDFGLVMQSLQGMSLSTEALKIVQDYYQDLARAEAATKNLTPYTPDALASENDAGEKFQFITGSRRPHTGEWEPFDLRQKQQEALAWLDANGNSGVCALETGVGKTAVSIGMMLKLVRDGLAEADSTYKRPDGKTVTTNGRFLFVCPTSLKGNIKKEIRNLLSDPGVMLDKLDVLSYSQFVGASRSKKVPTRLQSVPYWKKAGEWDPAFYAAIFFDEAQAMKDPASERAQAALKLYHPRKICLTASPMERNPMEAYVLAAISNNTPLFGKSVEAITNRQEMRRFKERFCEVVGGRIVGIKQEPLTQRDLHTWVKRNVFYADKTDVVEYKLPKPEVQVTPVTMPAPVEALYRDVAGQFSIIMQGAARKFTERTRGDAYADTQAERIFSKALAPVIRLLTDMGNRPAKALNDIAYAIERGTLPGFMDPDGNPVKLPKTFLQVLQKWAAEHKPEDIRALATEVGNPKLKAAEETLASRLESVRGSRSLLFADDKDLCMEAGQHLASTLAGTHVVALNDAIHIFRGGRELDRWVYPLDQEMMVRLHPDENEQKAILAKTNGLTVLPLPFMSRSYKKYPDLRGKQGVNQVYEAAEWQQFVLKEIVNPDPTIVTCTLLGKSYMYGHNLQGFNTVIHLDRNNWNSESMKQRTARAWRQGQTQVVQETTLDMTYAPDIGGVERPEFDKTLDEIRAAFQGMDAAIFDRIIKDAQTIALGAEWDAVEKKNASMWRLDEQVAELMASPFMGRANPPGART